eukprot:COSAG01_NODE_3597_length_5894_cov_1.898188_8_plen_49_part_01
MYNKVPGPRPLHMQATAAWPLAAVVGGLAAAQQAHHHLWLKLWLSSSPV